jgi:hypothetical protein
MFVNITEKHVANAKKVHSVYHSFDPKENGDSHCCVVRYELGSYYTINFYSEEESIEYISYIVKIINNAIGVLCEDFKLVLLSPDFAVRRNLVNSITVRSIDGSTIASFSIESTDVYRKSFESEKDAVDYINNVMNTGK